MEQFPKFVASRLARSQPQPSADPHPDADTLTAFVERRLKSAERQPVLAHLANCPDCREVLSLISAETSPVKKSPSPLWQLSWPAGLVAACCLVFTVVRTKPPVPPEKPMVAISPVAAPQPNLEPAKPKALPQRMARAIAPQPRIVPVSPQLVPPPPPDIPVPQAIAEKAPPMYPEPQQQQSGPYPQKTYAPAQSFAVQSDRVAHSLAPLRALAKTASLPPRSQLLWRIDAVPGTLLVSEDGGTTWRSIVVDSRTSLQALSVNGSDVWVGGEDGFLFHSTDNGLHWIRVTVSDGTTPLNTTITAIYVQHSQVIQLTTKSGEWLSSDAGRTWVTK